MATIVDFLQRHAEHHAADRAFVFLDGGEVAVGYAELDAAARRVASAVTALGGAGRPVLLLYPPGRAYVEGFLGCLYAGAIAVPAYPPDPAMPARSLPRLRALVADCGATVALGTSWLVDAVPALRQQAPEVAGLEWIATDTLPADDAWTPPRLTGESPALLQYTSGSTGAPKGVLLSHSNLLHNAGMVQSGFGSSPDDVGVSWLPPYHDMGLLGGILQPIYARLPIVLLSPLEFLQRPMAWLEAISRFGASMSGGPNFAFELCVRKSTPRQRAALDLSSWAVAFCGAEPVRAQTLDRFAAAFEPAGFRREAFYPCYGLAEATLIVTGGRAKAPPRLVRRGDSVHVGCGTALGDQTVAVVDPATGTACAPGVDGEIWVSGASVAQGYWRRPAETEQTFHARLADDGRRYLRTGDLGFLGADGELVVTGRAKDLIIVRGRNLHPEDIEHAVEQRVAGVRPGCLAAVAVDDGGEEHVAIAGEVTAADLDRAIADIRQTLAEVAEVSPATVVLLRPRTIPKTSSGKIQRHACRAALAGGEWTTTSPDVLARWDGRRASKYHHYGVDGPLTTAITAALGLDAHELDPDAPLTRLGLDSVRAVEVRHTLGEYGVDVSLSELLGGITAAELAGRAAGDPQPAEPTPVAEHPAPHGQAVPTVSDGQRALWFLQRWAPESTAYQITRAARIRSELDADALDRALRAVARRHPALRTCLPAEGGEPVARVLDLRDPVLTRHDVSDLDEGGLREKVQAAAASHRFDLERGPLFLASLFSRRSDDHVLLLSVHHVVADYWSLSVLVDDLLVGYRVEAAGTATAPPEPPAGAPPAAGDGHRPDMDRRLRYWRATLDGAPAALELPTSFLRPRLQSFRGASHPFRVEPPTLRALDALARDAGATRFATLLAGFAALLARYTGDDVVIGAPTAGRDDRRTAATVGYLVDPVPLRLRVQPGESFRDLVARARHAVLGALDNVVPFVRLVEAVRPPRDPGRPPVAQVMLTVQQPPPGRPDLGAFAVADETVRVQLGGLTVSPYRLADGGAAFDLSITLAQVAGGLSGSLEYCTDLFDEPAAARFARQLTTLLTHAAADPDAPVEALDLMDGRERAAVLAMADGGRTPIEEPATLHGLFAKQVAGRPQATAVISGDRTLSYAELDSRAARLATVLRGLVGTGAAGLRVIGVSLPRHEDAYVAFWAALMAGAAYLPLEPELPPSRLHWMIGDARPAVLLTHRGLADRLPAGGPPRLYLDEPLPPAGEPEFRTDAGPDDLAYIIYTSGSTGRPKGVLVSHRGACNVFRAESAALGLGHADRVLQYASCAYDVSVDEIIMAHLHAATLVVTPADATVPGPELVRLLTEQRITSLTLSPSALAAIPDAELPALARLLVGGEACTAELVDRWAPGRLFINGYGPSETTICVTLAVCEAGGPRPTIGRPIANITTYVLDDGMRPVPVGVPGELFIGGVGVGWGYLSRPALTAERFVADPFGPAPGARLYRTGDRVRWLPGGTLDFLGRLDDQVKVRGARVEPGEVEVRLRELFPVREAAVVPRPAPAGDGGPELVAYLVADGPRTPVAELRARLRTELPEPWVPAAFVYLDALPLNTSGKLDRRALPAPTPADRGVAMRVPPRTELEAAVAGVWASVLGVADIGVRDHFFDELGGSSLLVAKVASELGDRLGLAVPVTHLFEHPTVEALAGRLGRDREPGSQPGSPTRGRPEPAPGAEPEDHAAARRQALARRTRAASRRGD